MEDEIVYVQQAKFRNLCLLGHALLQGLSIDLGLQDLRLAKVTMTLSLRSRLSQLIYMKVWMLTTLV